MKREGEASNLSKKVVVYVSNSTGGQFASKIMGHFVIDDKKFRFIALAFGRIGGHNINLQLAKSSVNNLKKIGYDPELVQLEIQQKLLNGDIILSGSR
jgi:hypothetical protein